MKRTLPNIILIAAALIFSVNSFGQRYISEVFSSVDSTQNIVYGTNYSFLTGAPQSIPLVFDLYEPAGDVDTLRPLVIFIHTGSFLPIVINGTPTGTLRDSATSEICRRFARRGYVVASMDYRVGWNPIAPDQDVRTGTLLQAVGRAFQDARACVRYFKNDFANNNNTYGIDTSKIIFTGQGSGGYVALASATIHDTLEVWKPKFTASVTNMTYGFIQGASYWLSALWGDFDGNGGNPGYNNSGNNPGISGNVAMAINLGGAMGDSGWMDVGDVPMIAFHVTEDPFAPYAEGTVIVPTTGDPVVDVSGSYTVIRKATEFGNNNVFNTVNYNDVYTAHADLLNDGYDGLYPFVTNPAMQAGPWEWYDSTTTVAVALALGQGSTAGTNAYVNALQTNPDMSKAKGMAYIDTIMGYACPRIVQALNLGVGIDEKDILQQAVKVYPNPAADAVNLELTAGIKDNILDVRITDVSGRTIENIQWNASPAKKLQVDLKNYSAGIYVINISSKSFTGKHKLIVQ